VEDIKLHGVKVSQPSRETSAISTCFVQSFVLKVEIVEHLFGDITLSVGTRYETREQPWPACPAGRNLEMDFEGWDLFCFKSQISNFTSRFP
jgi:hypothetical protein